MLDAATGGSEPNCREPPTGVVTGVPTDCQSASLVDVYRQHSGRAVWALTDRRSALVEVSAPETAASESEAVLSHAHRVGDAHLGPGATVRHGRADRGRRDD